MEDILGVKLKKMFHMNTQNSGQNDEMKQKTLGYLKQLSKEQQRLLYNVYEPDFKMFDYDPYHV